VVCLSFCLSVGLSVCLSVSPHAETCRSPTAPVQVRAIRCGLLLQVWRGLSGCLSVCHCYKTASRRGLTTPLQDTTSRRPFVCVLTHVHGSAVVYQRLQLVLVRCSGCVCRDVFSQLLCVVSVAAPLVSSCSLFRLCAKSFCLSDHLDKHPVM